MGFYGALYISSLISVFWPSYEQSFFSFFCILCTSWICLAFNSSVLDRKPVGSDYVFFFACSLCTSWLSCKYICLALYQKRFIPLLGIIFLSPTITPLLKQTKINHSISGNADRKCAWPLRVSLANLKEYNKLKYNQSIGNKYWSDFRQCRIWHYMHKRLKTSSLSAQNIKWVNMIQETTGKFKTGYSSTVL